MLPLVVRVWFFALGKRVNNVDGTPGGFADLAELPIHALEVRNSRDCIFAE
jgi:hypothetical protein